MSGTDKKITAIILALCAAAILVVAYTVFDPATNAWFPKCPFRMATGLQCPGCGSQRAVHHLLNMRPAMAARDNVLVVAAIPYLILGVVLSTARPSPRTQALRKFLYGPRAIAVVLTLVVIFWILRNIPSFFLTCNP